MIRRSIFIGALTVAAALIFNVGSSAASVTIGAAGIPNYEPQSYGCSPGSPCTFYNATGGAGEQLTAPFDGVIVKWRIAISPFNDGQLRLRVLRKSGGDVIGVRGSELVSPGASDIQEFEPHLPISAGDTIGFNQENVGSSGLHVYVRDNTGAKFVNASPALANGETRPEPGVTNNQELLFNADVEPDVDCDGLGDETQDGGIGTCPVPPPPEVTDTTSPQILGVPSAQPSSFEVNRRGRRETAVSAAAKGTTLIYVVSEPSTVTFAVKRSTTGRKVGGKCRAKTRKNASRKRCRRFTKAGAFRTAASQGENRKPFSGRIGRRSLRPAKYRALVTAVDAAGNRSKPKTLKFKVVKHKRSRG
jgi:hypothetical protein